MIAIRYIGDENKSSFVKCQLDCYAICYAFGYRLSDER